MNRTRQLVALAALATLYVVSPVDAVPDVIPVAGVMDDALVSGASLLVGLLARRRMRRARSTSAPA